MRHQIEPQNSYRFVQSLEKAFEKG